MSNQVTLFVIFQLMCSYIFMPLAFIMGVSWEDSFVVAELVGTKTFLNEFVAYQKLSVLIKKRKAGGPEYINNVKQYISVRVDYLFFLLSVYQLILTPILTPKSNQTLPLSNPTFSAYLIVKY